MSRRSRNEAEAARRQRLIVIGSIVAVVVIAAIIAIVATSGGDSGTKVATGSQTRPVTVTGTPLPRFDSSDSDPAVGMTVPTISGQSFNGDPVKIDPTDGRPKVLLGVAHWCPHCQREVPLLSANIRANPLPASVEMIAISTSVQQNAPNYPPQAWLEREHWPTPVMADDDKNTAADSIGLSSFPYFVFTDAKGKVVARRAGEIPVEEFRQLVDQIAKTSSPN